MRAFAAAAALLVGAVLPLTAAPAQAHTEGETCSDATGTTVVVDFTDLGGHVQAGCAEDSAGMTGMQALEAAGFDVEAVTASGMTGPCRIDDQPSASEPIEVDGRDYTETCQKFPPGSAYWGYYGAPAGGAWAYAKKGADTNKVVPGGYEGWRFQLNQPMDSTPMPDFDPANPPTVEPAATDDTSDAADDSADDGSSIVWIGIGVAVLLALGVAYTLVRRRSSEDA